MFINKTQINLQLELWKTPFFCLIFCFTGNISCLMPTAQLLFFHSETVLNWQFTYPHAYVCP